VEGLTCDGFLSRRELIMSRQSLTKLASVKALGFLVFLFGLILVTVLSQTLRPKHTDFVFALSRRAVNAAVMIVSIVLAALIFFLARALRRRSLS
jgi:hypothetical protein